MRPKTLPKQILLIAVFVGLTFFAVYFLYIISEDLNRGGLSFFTEDTATSSIFSDQGQAIEDIATSSTFLGQDQASVGLPVRFKISSINVNASIEYVGLTEGGAMDVPRHPDDVAWFNLGSRPGEIGSAVIAGHYGWKNNTPSVFDDLHKLRIGDKISIEDENGEIINFVVRETRIYGKDDIVPEVFVSNSGKSHLNLITCTGDWNEVEKTYLNRFVVFTDREE